MNKVVKAKIYWFTEKEGGRNNIPNNRNYSTVACFKDIKDRYPDEAWSIVMNLGENITTTRTMVTDLRFLVECGPEELLYTGSQFALFEGKRKVAIGEVL